MVSHDLILRLGHEKEECQVIDKSIFHRNILSQQTRNKTIINTNGNERDRKS